MRPEKVTIQGPVGRLEAVLWEPEQGAAPRAVAVVAHPHPLHGGTMDNNVVHRTARGLHDAGLAVVRFNFRGTGASEGTHDGNGAEEEDLRAVLTWLAARFPGVEVWAGGFSFGSRTVAGLAPKEPRVARVLLVALPVLAYECSFALKIPQPGAIIMAGEDGFGTLAALKAQMPELLQRFDVQEVPGVDHFFTGALDELRARVRAWAEASLTPARPA
ncbi:MAG: alpha/beta fold hydrolase [Planctomycetota bacterium]